MLYVYRIMRCRVFLRRFSSGQQKKAIVRRPIAWQSEKYYDEKHLEEELRRVSDICHGCRRCFNLCDSFPILFRAVDAAPTEELDSVPSAKFKEVADACTLCDMCFTSKCPYTPPHEYDLDFPHLILRYRAVEEAKRNKQVADKHFGGVHGEMKDYHKPVPPMMVQQGVSRELEKNPSSFTHRLYSSQDVVGPIATKLAPIVNRVTQNRGSPVRSVMESVLGVDKNAPLPKFVSSTFMDTFKPDPPTDGKRVVLFVTCFANNNRPSIGHATVRLLRAAGVGVEACFPACCGMPQLESGLVGEVALSAKKISEQLLPYVEQGCKVVALTPSCALMLRQEWPLLLPEDASVRRVSEAAVDASECIDTLIKEGRLKPSADLKEAAVVTLHSACHSRAQNVGLKSKEILSAMPNVRVNVIERCSGHGGTWGFENYETALKVGGPVFAKALEDKGKAKASGVKHYVTSDCPLAAKHVLDGMTKGEENSVKDESAAEMHPVEIFAKYYFKD